MSKMAVVKLKLLALVKAKETSCTLVMWLIPSSNYSQEIFPLMIQNIRD